MQGSLGTPAFFITLNPSDMHNPVVCIWAGGMDPSSCRGLKHGIPTKLPNYLTRAKLIAKVPWAAVRFFHMSVTAVIECLLFAQPTKNPKPTNQDTLPLERGGILGCVTGYYMAVECQMRGSLHGHMIVWVEHVPTPSQFEQMVQFEPERTKVVLEWLQRIVVESVPFQSKLLHSTPSVSPQAEIDKDSVFNLLLFLFVFVILVYVITIIRTIIMFLYSLCWFLLLSCFELYVYQMNGLMLNPSSCLVSSSCCRLRIRINPTKAKLTLVCRSMHHCPSVNRNRSGMMSLLYHPRWTKAPIMIWMMYHYWNEYALEPNVQEPLYHSQTALILVRHHHHHRHYQWD